MNKYFGAFYNHDDVYTNYGKPDNFPTDDQIIYADYDNEDYSGYSHVLFVRDGKLYEVNGSHCSCYGLEDEWRPEETSAEAVKGYTNFNENKRAALELAGL